MASVTVNTTGFWGVVTPSVGTWAGLVYGDTVTVINGAILTLDPAQSTTNIGIGVVVTCNDDFSEFKIVNTSTTTSVVFYGKYQGKLQIEAGSKFSTLGGYITIYTGDGTEGQTTSGWTTAGYSAEDEPAILEVETGNGTGIFDNFINLGDLSLVTNIGVGELGKWFTYNNTTGVITFGDGGQEELITTNATSGQKVIEIDTTNYLATDIIHVKDDNGQETLTIDTIDSGTQLTVLTDLENSYTTADNGIVRHVKGGNLVKNGAKVRAYNIGIGTINGTTKTIEATSGNNFDTDVSVGGILDISKTYGFGFFITTSNIQSITLANVGLVVTLLLTQTRRGVFSSVFKCVSRYTDALALQFFNGVSGCSFTDSVFCRKLADVVDMDGSSDISYTDSCFYLLTRNASTDNPIFTDGNLTLTRCDFIGGEAAINSGNVVATDCRHSDSPHGEPYGGSYGRAIVSTSTNLTVDGLTQILDGTPAQNTSSFLDGITLCKNVNYETKSANGFSPSTNKECKIVNCYFGDPTSRLLRITATSFKTTVQNVTGKSFTALFGDELGPNEIIKGVDASTRNVYQFAGVSNTYFYELRLASTTGVMGVFFTPQTDSLTPAYVLSGANDVKFSGSGQVRILANNGYIEYTWPHLIIGITSFPSTGTILKNGSGTGNFVVEYQIDVGAGYTTLNTLNYTNLSAHTIDPDLGFKFKLRISRVTGSSTEYLNRLNWETVVDYLTYKYPTNIVSFNLSNIVVGSTYWIYNNTSDSLITSGTAVTSSISYESGADTNDNITIRVRKSSSGTKYLPYESQAVVSGTEVNVFVSQIEDIIVG